VVPLKEVREDDRHFDDREPSGPNAVRQRQPITANYGLTSAHANGGGVAFVAHVGGFVFGLIVARWLLDAQSLSRRRSVPVSV
jgi:hypothetical protein